MPKLGVKSMRLMSHLYMYAVQRGHFDIKCVFCCGFVSLLGHGYSLQNLVTLHLSCFFLQPLFAQAGQFLVCAWEPEAFTFFYHRLHGAAQAGQVRSVRLHERARRLRHAQVSAEHVVQAFWAWAQPHQANELRYMFMAIRGGSSTLAKSRGSLSGRRGFREVIGYLQLPFKEGYVWDVQGLDVRILRVQVAKLYTL